MYVTAHARARLYERMQRDQRAFGAIIGTLESMPGEPGMTAYILDRLDKPVHTADGSNGDVVVAIADGGTVSTIYLRRREQDHSAGFFGVDRVVEL